MGKSRGAKVANVFFNVKKQYDSLLITDYLFYVHRSKVILDVASIKEALLLSSKGKVGSLFSVREAKLL